jgi:hypothetical protein
MVLDGRYHHCFHIEYLLAVTESRERRRRVLSLCGLYAGERMADGAVLYKDINDMNPPLIYILQMPAVWMSNTFHPQPHVFLYAGLWVTFGGILLLLITWAGKSGRGRGCTHSCCL